MIKIPYTLKNFNLFVDGNNYAGLVEEATPPKISIKNEEHRAGGMDGPIPLDMGMEEFSLEMTIAENNADLLKATGILNAKETQFTLRGAMNNDASPGDTKAIVVNGRGGISEADLGSWKSGDKTQLKLTAKLKAYKLTIDGDVIYDIDFMTMKRVINGTDQLESQRGAIGL